MSTADCPRPPAAGLNGFQLYVLERLDGLAEDVASIKGAGRLASMLPSALACLMAGLALMGFGRG